MSGLGRSACQVHLPFSSAHIGRVSSVANSVISDQPWLHLSLSSVQRQATKMDSAFLSLLPLLLCGLQSNLEEKTI